MQVHVLVETQSKLAELRRLLERIEKEAPKKRKSIAEEAQLNGSEKARAAKISKFLGKTNGPSDPKGIDAESALRLQEYALSWLRDHPESTSDDDSARASQPEPSNGVFPDRRGPSRTWLVDAKQENKFEIQGGDLGLVVGWLGSIREAPIECIALVTGTGNRIILPRTGGIGGKIENFNRSSVQPLLAEEMLKSDTNRALVSRYVDAAWSVTIKYTTDSNEFEFEITTPQGAIKAGSEVEVWAREPEGLVLIDPRKARSVELMELAKKFPDLLDEALHIR